MNFAQKKSVYYVFSYEASVLHQNITFPNESRRAYQILALNCCILLCFHEPIVNYICGKYSKMV